VIRYICIGLLSFSYATAYATESATALDYLNKMGTALQSLNYYGTVVYLQNGHIESMRIVHKAGEDGEIERVVHLSGKAREIIRNNDVVTCYFSDTQSVVVDKQHFKNRLAPGNIENYEEFVDTYVFLINGEDRVAGRMTQIIEIKPKDKYRYGYRLWIDQSNWLLLKSELRNANGKIMEQLMFTDVQVVDSIPASMLKPDIASDKYTWFNGKLVNGRQKLGEVDWHATNLPNGYSIKDHYRQVIAGGDTPVDHMVISDGLATVSVYIEPFSAESQTFVGASNVGVTNIFGSILDDHHVTVVGAVPQRTVEIIANSIHQAKVAEIH